MHKLLLPLRALEPNAIQEAMDGHLVSPLLAYVWAIALSLLHAGMTVLVTVMLATKERTHSNTG